MYQVIRELYSDELEEAATRAMEKGIEKGMEKGMEKCASEMLKEGKFSLEEAAKYSTLDINVVRELAKKLSQESEQ